MTQAQTKQTQTEQIELSKRIVNERLDGIIPDILKCGHRMTMTEMLAEVLHGDHRRAGEVATEYATGENKRLVDAIARRLRNLGWYQRKVLRERERKLRWVNPQLEGRQQQNRQNGR